MMRLAEEFHVSIYVCVSLPLHPPSFSRTLTFSASIVISFSVESLLIREKLGYNEGR